MQPKRTMRPLMPYRDILVARYWERAIPSADPDACWGWRLRPNHAGYGVVSLYIDGKQVAFIASRVSYLAHHGVEPSQWVLHHCDHPLCTNPRHIYDGGPPENSHDRDSRGRGVVPDNRGERHGMAKLTAPVVRAIRLRWHTGGVSQPQIAQDFGVSLSTISDILIGDRWGHTDLDIPRAQPRQRLHLDDKTIQVIRTSRVDGMRLREIADHYEISMSAVTDIVLRRTYKHVE